MWRQNTFSATSCAPFAFSLLISYFSAVYLFSITEAVTSYPCHPSKKVPNFDVKCTTVRLPSSLCLSCPLRPPASDGSFVDCNNIFDVSSPACYDSLQEYVNLNPCDHVRKVALNSFRSDPTNDSTRSILDYFLYSICENCCDCIPMGRTAADYDGLLESHKTIEPTLWKEDRGNCPAHAVYDVCKVLPNVQLFSSADIPAHDAPAACPALNMWLSSPAASNWAANPETQISNYTRMFLRSLLEASNCKNRQIWTRCHILEETQGNLDLPDGYTLPPVTTLPPITVTTMTTKMATISPMPSPSNSPSGQVSLTLSPSVSSTLSATQTASPSQSTSLSLAPTSAFTTSMSLSSTPKVELVTVSPVAKTSNPSETATGTNTPTNLPTSSDVDSDGSDRNTPAEMETTTASPEDDPENEEALEEAACFPWNVMVYLEGGARAAMGELRVGDRVQVSSYEFSEVFVFTHRDKHSSATRYVELTTSDNVSITVTGSHLIYVSGGVIQADDCRRGDKILTISGWKVVTAVRDVIARGLYNPQTLHGDIVVNGVVVSTFTTAVERHVASGMLSPLRALYRVGLTSETFWDRLFSSIWLRQMAYSLHGLKS